MTNSSTYPEGYEQQVTLEPFLIGRREATNGEYAAFIKAMGGTPPSYFKDGQVRAGRERSPVYDVDWESAQRFARWCGADLPLEAQWEAAARGPKSLLYPWGTSFTREHLDLPKGRYFDGQRWIPRRVPSRTWTTPRSTSRPSACAA